MRFKSEFILKNDEDSFKKYINYYSSLIKQNSVPNQRLTIEEYILYQKYVLLDDVFWTSLNDEELAFCKTNFNKNYRDQSIEERNTFRRSFIKWGIVFFSSIYTNLFKELNTISIGITIKSIRQYEGVKQSDLARMLDVNRKTLSLIESGERFPTLLLIYRFAQLFQITIDDIIELSNCSN